jgi:peptide/nickel transport system permease protein
MLRYILKRIGWGLVTLFLFVTALFFLVNILVPGDFTSQFLLTGEQRERLAQDLGIDRSLWEQYWEWIRGLATGNLGYSHEGPTVASRVVEALGTSLLVFFAGMLIAFPLGNWLGRIGAWKKKGIFLGSSTFVAVVFFTAFPPSLAFLLERALLNSTSPQTFLSITTLDREMWILPDYFGFVRERPPGLSTPGEILWQMALAVLIAVVIVMLINGHYRLRAIRPRGLPPVVLLVLMLGIPWLLWILMGLRTLAVDLLASLLLLIVGVVLLFYGEMQLVTEAAMEDAVDTDYVMTARAKGVKERHIRDRHAARAALLPVLSRLVVSLPYFLAGMAILEEVFQVPGGLGALIFDAIRNQDTPAVVGSLVVVGALSLGARLMLDVLYAIFDPRIRYGSGKLEVEVG